MLAVAGYLRGADHMVFHLQLEPCLDQDCQYRLLRTCKLEEQVPWSFITKLGYVLNQVGK